MKVSLIFLAIFAVANAVSIHTAHPVNKESLEKQRQILDLLYHVNQDSFLPEHIEIASKFNPIEHADLYAQHVVENFTLYYEDGLLSKDEIFSIFYDEHLEEAIALFKLFYHAKDWDTFYKTAVWARQHVNPAMFVYAIYVNIVHHPKVQDIYLPPIYEVLPHYFFSSEVIHKAYEYKMIHETRRAENHQENHWHTIKANHSGHYLNLHPEQMLSYWTEDVEINAQNYYYHINFPFWMKSSEYGWKNNRRGHIFLVLAQNVLGRYYLERLSHGQGAIPELDAEKTVDTPYVPHLVYPNGAEFPQRPVHAKLHSEYNQKYSHLLPIATKSRLQDWVRRVNDAIDIGKVYDEEHGKKVNLSEVTAHEVIGNLLQGNADSPSRRYYGQVLTYARRIFGHSAQAIDSHHVVPSALEHEETAMRDPVFYQILKKIMHKYHRYIMQLPSYTEEQLTMPGVEITKVEISDLITYDDWSQFDLTNAVYYSDTEKHDDFQVRVRQSRLNNMPFSMNIHVNSDKEQNALVKIFLGPKYDEYNRQINITENHLNFIPLHHFKYVLKAGENAITIQSQDIITTATDRTGFSEMYKKLTSAIEDKGEFRVNNKQNSGLWPLRYVLPKGTESGFPVQFYVYIYPEAAGQNVVERHLHKSGRPEMYVDETPMLYPLDRLVKHEHMFLNIRNAHWQDGKVYHKQVQDINSPHHH